MATKSDNSASTSRVLARLLSVVGMGVFHLTAVSIIFFITLLPFTYGRIGIFVETLGSADFFYAAVPQIGIHLAIATAIWGVLYGLWALRGSEQKQMRAIRSARGTAITETIIVMPVLLLLILGMAQMAINSAAGMLANLAAYEAARTAWVWHPEQSRFTGGGTFPGTDVVNDNYVEEMARIQAAAVMTPVAHSYGTGTGTFSASAGSPGIASAHASEEFRQFRGALVGAQIDRGGDLGSAGLSRADVLAEGGAGVGGGGHAFFGGEEGTDGYSFVMALDSSRYPVRSAWKLSGAYLSITVDVDDSGTTDDGLPEIQTTLQYRHFLAMPLIGPVFGQREDVGTAPGGRAGYYADYQRIFTYIQQPESHPGVP